MDDRRGVEVEQTGHIIYIMMDDELAPTMEPPRRETGGGRCKRVMHMRHGSSHTSRGGA